MGKGREENYMSGMKGFIMVFFASRSGWTPGKVHAIVQKTKVQAVEGDAYLSIASCRAWEPETTVHVIAV